MSYKTLILLLATTLLCSCKSKQKTQSISGKYVSEKYKIASKIFMALRKESYVLNSVLILNNDSSYLLNTCGNIIKGKWINHNDSLFLFCHENYIIKDSIRNSRIPSCGGKPSIFIIDKKKAVKLKSSFYFKSKKTLNNLIKVE